ncbi:MAG: M48 family metallopeptidase [Fervidobacterium sp.]
MGLIIQLIVFLVIIRAVWEIGLTVTNVSYSTSKSAKIPDVLSDIISKENFEKTKSYTKDRAKVSIYLNIVSTIVEIMFILLGFPWLEKIVIQLSSNIYIQALLFFGIYELIDSAIKIPFDVYSIFVIEQKYGFNTTTPKTFTKDKILSLLLVAIIGAPLLCALIWFLSTFRTWWWQVSILAITIITFFSYIQPILIAPLFYKFTELEEGTLKEKLKALLKKIGIEPKIYVMNASKRTKKHNAYLTGMGTSRRLVLYDNILSQSDEEILAVVAHELGHHAHKHIPKLIALSGLSITFTMFIVNQIYNLLNVTRPFDISRPYTIIAYAFIFASSILYFLMPLFNYLERKMEYQADEYSAKHTQPSYLISALKKLVRDNLSNPNPLEIYKIWYYNHPSPEERIRKLMILEK